MTNIRLAPIGVAQALKDQVYSMLKDAITEMDIYSTPEPPKLDERTLVKRLILAARPNRLSLSQHIEKYVTYLDKTRPVVRLYR